MAKLLFGDDNSAVSVSMPGTIGYMAPGTPSHTSLVFFHAKLLIHAWINNRGLFGWWPEKAAWARQTSQRPIFWMPGATICCLARHQSEQALDAAHDHRQKSPCPSIPI